PASSSGAHTPATLTQITPSLLATIPDHPILATKARAENLRHDTLTPRIRHVLVGDTRPDRAQNLAAHVVNQLESPILERHAVPVLVVQAQLVIVVIHHHSSSPDSGPNTRATARSGPTTGSVSHATRTTRTRVTTPSHRREQPKPAPAQTNTTDQRPSTRSAESPRPPEPTPEPAPPPTGQPTRPPAARSTPHPRTSQPPE